MGKKEKLNMRPDQISQLYRQKIGLVLGPMLFILVLVSGPRDLPWEATVVAAGTVWMAVWWLCESIPIAATALLPIILFPAFGALRVNEVTTQYGNQIVFLMIGGFFIAIAVEKWNLHLRIALSAMNFMGMGPRKIIAGFMISTAFLSAWISNTATALVMMPIGMAVITKMSLKRPDPGFNVALMLSIAYAASIGGMATLVGTPPNLIFAGVYESMIGRQVSFFEWALFGFPLAAFILFITWIYLTRIGFSISNDEVPGSRDVIKAEIEKLGRITREEKHVLLIFCFVALSWMTRGPLWGKYVPLINDASIAVTGALLLFLIPARGGTSLLTWEDTTRLPWGVAILLGGGFAIARGFIDTGLAEWISEFSTFLGDQPAVLIILIGITVTKLLTEVTSNTATATILIPIAASIATTLNISHFGIMAAIAISSSLAFMMPIATPPNAIIFGSGYVTIPQMARAGIWLNIATIIIMVPFAYFMS